MTPERAKELLPVIQAFAAGKQIQYRASPSGSWSDTPGYTTFNGSGDYRIKPETVKHRRWLYKTSYGTAVVSVVHEADDLKRVENYVGFVRWIDTEWQEVEV